jgi:putative transposase
VFLDGFGMGEHLLVGALGVADDGTKVPLGVAEAPPRTRRSAPGWWPTWLTVPGPQPWGAVCHRRRQGLERAIRAVFGAKALIPRCRQHKERNVLDHLPEAERPLVQRRLRAAWALGDAERARAELEQLARSLDRQRPGAAASLREGLELSLTVTRLGSAASCCRPWPRPTRSSR